MARWILVLAGLVVVVMGSRLHEEVEGRVEGGSGTLQEPEMEKQLVGVETSSHDQQVLQAAAPVAAQPLPSQASLAQTSTHHLIRQKAEVDEREAALLRWEQRRSKNRETRRVEVSKRPASHVFSERARMSHGRFHHQSVSNHPVQQQRQVRRRQLRQQASSRRPRLVRYRKQQRVKHLINLQLTPELRRSISTRLHRLPRSIVGRKNSIRKSGIKKHRIAAENVLSRIRHQRGNHHQHSQPAAVVRRQRSSRRTRRSMRAQAPRLTRAISRPQQQVTARRQSVKRDQHSIHASAQSALQRIKGSSARSRQRFQTHGTRLDRWRRRREERLVQRRWRDPRSLTQRPVRKSNPARVGVVRAKQIQYATQKASRGLEGGRSTYTPQRHERAGEVSDSWRR